MFGLVKLSLGSVIIKNLLISIVPFVVSALKIKADFLKEVSRTGLLLHSLPSFFV